MDEWIIGWVFVAEIALFGGFALLLPRIGRRGLLFGIYVGEAAHHAEPARAVRRSWDRGIVVSTLACLVLAAALAVGRRPFRALAPEFLLIAVGVGLYLHCHLAARRIARATLGDAAVPPAAASLSTPASSTVLPWIALLAGVG